MSLPAGAPQGLAPVPNTIFQDILMAPAMPTAVVTNEGGVIIRPMRRKCSFQVPEEGKLT